MNSDLRLRIPAVALICFSCNLLLIGRIYGNNSENGFRKETQKASDFQQLSPTARRYGGPTKVHEQGFERELSAVTRTAVAEADRSPAVPVSVCHQAPSDCNHSGERGANLMCTRRALRDISPPGMWPPGPPRESLPWISRRRALRAATDDGSNGSTETRMQLSVRPPSVVQPSQF